MEVKPDFGYEGDNFCLDEDHDAPRNWQLLSEIISSRKHEWLRNHIELRHIRRKQEEEAKQRKLKASQAIQDKLAAAKRLADELKIEADESGNHFLVKTEILDDMKALEA